MVSLNPIEENMVFREAEKEFDKRIDRLIEENESQIPIDDLVSIIDGIKASPLTNEYLTELNLEISKYNRERNWDARRSGR